MFWYNIKTAIRNFNSQRKISLLNLLGLSIGMTVAILIFYFVWFERSYDNFHKDSNLIYRIISVDKGTGGTDYFASTPLPLPDVVRTDIKDVVMSTSLSGFLREDESVMVDNQAYYNLTGYTTDSCFLKMFNFPLLTGDPKTVFNNPGLVVITQGTAKKLFGNQNPMGKEVTIDKFTFAVAGIMKDLPENSIFKFDLLVSHLILNKMHPDLDRLWYWGGPMIFIKIHPSQNIASIKTNLSLIPDKYFPDYLKGRESYDIQPLKTCHLDNRIFRDIKSTVSSKYLNILLLIATAVLFIACANFVNLSTSQSEKRARETAIRKISGGGRFQITCLFIGEAVTLSLIALIVAIYLSTLFLPWFNILAQRNLHINFSNPGIVLCILLFGVLTGILSGLYPALFFSKYRPIEMLQSRITSIRNKSGLRKGFIIIQFLITIILISCQLFIVKQVSFMKNHDLGFNVENLLSIPLYNNEENKRLAFARLLSASIENEATTYSITGITLSENVPGQFFPNKFATIPEGASKDDSKEMVVTSLDEQFVRVFDIPVVIGRTLSDTILSDRSAHVLINEMAALKFGWDNPIGKQLRFKHEKESITVVGMLKDYNFKSLQSPIEPVVYRYAGENWLAGYLTFRVDHNKYMQTIKFLKTTWEKLAPGVPFQYFFVKDKYLEKYMGEERLAKIVGTFAMIAVFLSCLGLFAMIAYLSVRRTKEIGIRKINGAKVIQVIFMLGLDFLKWVTIAFVIACPVVWLIMNRWLEDFAYKTKLSWWVFGLAGLIALGIALFTVSLQSWRAATRNPVEALRYD
ncbi:MAG: ABC transporter permease [Bacteroidales bacterium]